ncbi:hypothetical protein EDC04DRAFT_2602849 [Pisolithus marmoratus]|nr:hypothetical protein EDC04DRAFT_2602849 [Pisolithus marmoratus]
MQTSGIEEPVPAHSSLTSSAEEQPRYCWRATPALSGHISAVIQLWALSSFSSLEPLHSPSGRLLTLHLEKDQSVIWPSLIVAPVPQELSLSTPIPILILFAIELLGIRKDREEAFECFILGQPYLEAGLLHLEGATPIVLSASYATLSSIRIPTQPQPENGAEAWKRDRDAASRYFDCARAMNSDLDIPIITDERSGQTRQEWAKDELIFIDDVKGKDNMDNAWYLYVPSLVGAGTALLVIGVIGALTGGGIRGLDSLSHWDSPCSV